MTNNAVFNAESLNLWLAFWCDLIGAGLVGIVAAFSVGLAGGAAAGVVCYGWGIGVGACSPGPGAVSTR